jgi:hypothetical protein
MTQGNRTAIHVDFIALQTQHFFHGEILCREGLVHFHEVHLFQLEPGALQRLLRGRHGANAHDARLDPGNPPRNNPSQRFPGPLARRLAMRYDHRGGTIHDAAGVSSGNHTLLAEGRGQGGQGLQSRFRPAMIVGRKRRYLAPGLDLDRGQFLLDAPRLIGGFGQLLAAQSEFVAGGAGDAVLGRQVLRGIRHGAPAIAVAQAAHQRIFQLAFAQTEAGTGATHHVRGLRHILHAAGQHQLRFAEQDALCPLGNGFDAGTAEPVHRDGRGGDGQTRFERHVARAIERVGAGLHHVAENGVVEFRRVRARAAHRFARGDRTQFIGAGLGKRSGVARHRRARPGHNHNLSGKHAAP